MATPSPRSRFSMSRTLALRMRGLARAQLRQDLLAVDAQCLVGRLARRVLQADDRRAELLDLCDALAVLLRVGADDVGLPECVVGDLALGLLVHRLRVVPVVGE